MVRMLSQGFLLYEYTWKIILSKNPDKMLETLAQYFQSKLPRHPILLVITKNLCPLTT